MQIQIQENIMLYKIQYLINRVSLLKASNLKLSSVDRLKSVARNIEVILIKRRIKKRNKKHYQQFVTAKTEKQITLNQKFIDIQVNIKMLITLT